MPKVETEAEIEIQTKAVKVVKTKGEDSKKPVLKTAFEDKSKIDIETSATKVDKHKEALKKEEIPIMVEPQKQPKLQIKSKEVKQVRMEKIFAETEQEIITNAELYEKRKDREQEQMPDEFTLEVKAKQKGMTEASKEDKFKVTVEPKSEPEKVQVQSRDVASIKREVSADSEENKSVKKTEFSETLKEKMQKKKEDEIVLEVKEKQTKPIESKDVPKSQLIKQQKTTTSIKTETVETTESVANIEPKAKPIEKRKELEIQVEGKKKEEPVLKKKTEDSSLLIKTKAEETAFKGTPRNCITPVSENFVIFLYF